MNKIFLMVGVMTIALTCCGSGQVQVGLSASDRGVEGFYFAIGQYYHVPQKDVVVIRERHIPDEEVPVVFFISRRAHVPPATIVDMRMHGDSWMSISMHYGLGPEAYYVPVREVSGPPYGNAYGYYRKHPRKEWKQIVLSDDDIVNFVNLRFAKDHYNCPSEDVVRMRSDGRSFVAIHDQIRENKSHRDDQDDQGREGKHHGKGKGKHKGWKDDTNLNE